LTHIPFNPTTPPINRDILGNINMSLDNVASSVLDVELVFGPELSKTCVDKHGNINYMMLYDELLRRAKSDPNDPKLLKFERVFDSFNRYKQYTIENESVRIAQEELKRRANDITLIGEKFKHSKGNSDLKISTLMWSWQASLEHALTKLFEEIKQVDIRKRKSRKKATTDKNSSIAEKLHEYSEILLTLGPHSLSIILSLEMAVFSLKESRKNGADSNIAQSLGTFYYAASIVQGIGKAVEDAFATTVATNFNKDKKVRFVSELTKQTFKNEEQVEIADKLNTISKQSLASNSAYKYWISSKIPRMTAHDRVQLGSRLLLIILENCKVMSKGADPKLVPAFWHTYEFSNSKYVGVIKINDSLKIRISSSELDVSTVILTQTPPMLVKPRPWISNTEGGYWYAKQSLITTKPNNAPEQHAYLNAAIKGNYMNDFLMCLDDISQCAWAVNRQMLDIILEIWKSGKECLGIPPLVGGMPPQEMFKHISQNNVKVSKEEYNQMSARISFGYILRTAEVYAAHGERFYFPYKIDFRGRVYPLTNSGFWHLGADYTRCLFQFWYGKSLGPNGLDWVKIHLANMFGEDKVSNADRVKFVDSHWDEIVDSADHPLDGNKWWTKGDKPFQTLAACFDVVAAVRSGNPASYISRLPIAQDGSCNGLQHYAGLGRDIEGAKQVSLISQEKPSDVYSKVQQLVVQQIEKDAKMRPGSKVYNKLTSLMAQELEGKISRKVVKQPVMTSVYGVTQFGIVDQVLDKLKDDSGLDRVPRVYYGLYIARHIKKAIRELFIKAHEIQDWLDECAERICESVRWDVYGDESVVKNKDFLKKFVTVMTWTTPLGLPIVQPYRKRPLMLIRTPLQTIALQNPYEYSWTNKAKQRSGIAPNYIHGLDSTHMLMTAHECIERGITFAAVHDSFWTHASSIPLMNRLLREQFVKLHENDLVGALREEFRARYAGYLQCVYINSESEAGKAIARLRSSYFYSQELLEDGEAESRVRNDDENVYDERGTLEAQKEFINSCLASGTLKELKLTKSDELFALRHELGEEYNRYKLLSHKDVAKQEKGKRIITPSVIIEQYQEPVVWKFNPNNKSEFKLYDETLPRRNFKEENISDIAEQAVLLEKSRKAEFEEEVEKEADYEEDEEKAEATTTKSKTNRGASRTKWMKVLVPLKLPNVPSRGDFDIKQVLDSQYFFS
jgi:DNA-directed RNA polymerase